MTYANASKLAYLRPTFRFLTAARFSEADLSALFILLLQSVLLIITCAGALILRAGGIEVVLQRYADFSGILVGVAGQNFYRIVAFPFVMERSEDVVGKEYCRELTFQESLL